MQSAFTEFKPKFYKRSSKNNPGSALVLILQVALTRAGICLQGEKNPKALFELLITPPQSGSDPEQSTLSIQSS